MLAKECGRVLAALAEPLVAEAEVRAGLRDDLPLGRDVEDRAFPREAGAVHDVELRLLERRRHLVLHDLHPDAVADRLDAFLQRLDPADVEADRRVELERTAARRRLRVAEHDADLLAQLVREQADRVGAVQCARELAERLRHETSLQADVRIAHLTLDLRLRRERGDGVDRHHVERPRSDEELGDLERLLAGVGLRDEEVVDVDADALRVLRIHGVLRVDERADAAAALRLGDHVVDERRLAGRLGPEHLDDAATWKSADPERQIERQRPGGHRTDRYRSAVVHLHDRSLAELPLDLAESDVQSFVLIHLSQPPRATVATTSYRAPPGPSRDR